MEQFHHINIPIVQYPVMEEVAFAEVGNDVFGHFFAKNHVVAKMAGSI
jgi:hypothetical protein